MKIVSKFVVISTLAVASMSGFAAGGAGGAPEIQSGASVTVSNNKASRIMAAGASGTASLGLPESVKKYIDPTATINASGETNINSVIVSNGGKIGGTVLVDGNKAEDVYNLGGGNINVNSVVLK